MKIHCERCHRPFDSENPAYCCPYQTTFCQKCAESMQYTCPDCSGQLLLRAREAV